MFSWNGEQPNMRDFQIKFRNVWDSFGLVWDGGLANNMELVEFLGLEYTTLLHTPQRAN